MVSLLKLTELTILYLHPRGSATKATGIPIDVDEAARSATLELVDACKAPADFDRLQIVHFLPRRPSLTWLNSWLGGQSDRDATQRDKALTEQLNGLKDWLIECLRKPDTGCQDGEGRKMTRLRVIKLGPDDPYGESHLDSLTVGECEV